MARTLTLSQRLHLIAHAMVDYRTLARAYEGRPMRPKVHERIAVAARELRLPPPRPLKRTA